MKGFSMHCLERSSLRRHPASLAPQVGLDYAVKICVLNSELRIVRLEPMGLSRSTVNLIFGVAVAALGSAAAVSWFSTDRPHIHAENAGAMQMPEEHPPLDLEERISAIERLSAAEPQNPEYPAQIGNLYYDSGRYEKAAEYYERSLRLGPRNPNVETDLATCLHYMGQHDRSIQVLDNVLSYSPAFAQARFNKGIVLAEGKKDVAAGIAVWEDLLRSDPGYPHRAELERRIAQMKASIR